MDEVEGSSVVRPQPSVLFAQSFLHPHLSEYVDEVRFAEPVVICACEFLELHTSSSCASLTLSGLSSPPSFALEIFIRTGGEARFKRLCPAFLYTPSACSVLEVQAAVTDHLVIRGSYRALSLVVYGNPAKDLGQLSADYDIDNSLSELTIPSETAFHKEDLPEVLQFDKGKPLEQLPALQCLQLVNYIPEQRYMVAQLLQLIAGLMKATSDKDALRRFYPLVITTASVMASQSETKNDYSQWKTSMLTHRQQQMKSFNSLKEIKEQAEKLFMESTDMDAEYALQSDLPVTEMIWCWLKASFTAVRLKSSSSSDEESLFSALAATQLLCSDTKWCFQFVTEGQMCLLLDILEYTSAESISAGTLLVLEAIRSACFHAFSCEALLGWWLAGEGKEDNSSAGYALILKVLLQTRHYQTAHLAFQILHCLRAYELAANFQYTVEPLLQDTEMKLADSDAAAVLNSSLKKAVVCINQLNGAITAKDAPQEWALSQISESLIMDSDDNTFGLTRSASSKFSTASKDLSGQMLSLLQGRRLIPLLAAILSSPLLRSSVGKTRELFLELLGAVEAVLLTLANYRSGLLFLASDLEAARSLVSALEVITTAPESENVNLRYATSMASAGFLCQAPDIATILRTSLCVVSAVDNLLAVSEWSEDWLWALWELSCFSRSEGDRQALSMIVLFPEAFAIIMNALQPRSQALLTVGTEMMGLKRAILHSAVEVMQVILMDSAFHVLATWLPHAVNLQRILQSESQAHIDITMGSHAAAGSAVSKDALCVRLLELVDPAVIYHKKGASGLVRYAAAIVAGSSNQIGAAESLELDSGLGDGSGMMDFPSVDTLIGRSVSLVEATAILSDTAISQLTVSMRILSSISCHPAVAATLYGEGAMAVLYTLLECGSSFLQTSTSDFDSIIEEEGDVDATVEMLKEQERERLILSLLLPTLLALLNLLQRLQVTGEEYRNTRLVDVLIQLHRSLSARLASRTSISFQSSGMVVLSGVSCVVTSVLACWPVFGWTPSLFPKLMNIDTGSVVLSSVSLPLEPREAVNMLSIMVEILPEERPQLCTTRAAAMSITRSFALQSLLGQKGMAIVGWHCQPPESEKLLESLSQHLNNLSLIVCHLAYTTCDVLQNILRLLIVRIACQNEEYASVLLRPILHNLRDSFGVEASLSDVEYFKAGQLLFFVMELVKHPAAKHVLIKDDIIKIILRGLESKSNRAVEEKQFLGLLKESYWHSYILKILATICEPDLMPQSSVSLSKYLIKGTPKLEDLCLVLVAVMSFLKCAPIGKEMEAGIEVLGRIATHKLGKVAFASYALKAASNTENREAGLSSIEKNDVSDFLAIWRCFATTLESEKDVSSSLLRIIEQFAHVGICLSAAGRSGYGLGTLQYLLKSDVTFGCSNSMETDRDPLSDIVRILNSRKEGLHHESHDNSKKSYEKPLRAVSVLARLLKRPVSPIQLQNKTKMVQDTMVLLQNQNQNQDSLGLPIYWKLLPSLFIGFEKFGNSGSQEDSTESLVPNAMKDKFTWECSASIPARPAYSSILEKRKLNVAAGDANRRHRTDNASLGQTGETTSGGRTGSSTLANASNRRDTFRQRKPNTSRPPSMHVDDYVARERGSESVSVGSGMNQRSALGGGRPPSIHVDEFMARQRERQQVMVSETQQTPPKMASPVKAESIVCKESSVEKVSSSQARLLEDDAALEDVDIEIGTVPDGEDFLSLPLFDDVLVNLTEEGNTLLTVPTSACRQDAAAEVSQSNVQKETETLSVTVPEDVSAGPSEKQPEMQSRSPAKVVRQATPEKNSSPLVAEEKHTPPFSIKPSTTNADMATSMPEVLQPSVVAAGSGSAFVGDQRAPVAPPPVLNKSPSQFPIPPPFPPSLPPPPPIPAGVTPQKFEPSGSPIAIPQPSFESSANASGSITQEMRTPLLTDYHRVGESAFHSTAPPQPTTPWSQFDPSIAPRSHPVSMNYSLGVPSSHPRPVLDASQPMQQQSVPTWPGLVRSHNESGSSISVRTQPPQPPLPPNPPPFPNPQMPVVHQNPPHSLTSGNSASIYTHTLSNVPVSTFSHSTGIDENRASPVIPSNLGPSLAPQSTSLSPSFIPPLPPGRPNVSQSPPVSGVVMQPSQIFPPPPPPSRKLEPNLSLTQQLQAQLAQPLYQPMRPQLPPQPSQPPLPPMPVSQQQDSGKLLQQILASPDAIQDLLKDQTKLQQLLEQHPKLIYLLQEKMGQS